MDVNKDGSLSRGELHGLLRRYGYDDGRIGHMFDEMDIDRNGKIQYNELNNYWHKLY